ncbi:TIM barrel protein [Priestia endophytica]|nr:TIM barrel protein [Priestia endophytica]
MMKVSITTNRTDLSDRDLKQLSQIGVDCLDFGKGSSFVGVSEQGYPDLDELLKLKKRVRSFGLEINRVTLPNLTEKFMNNRPGSERELENACAALKVFGEAGISIARQRLEGDTFPYLTTPYTAVHRGGATARGESLGFTKEEHPTPTLEEHEKWWSQFCAAYGELVPVGEESNVLLGMHPSDSPHPDTPFGGLGYHRVIDAFPSKNVGYVYCVGTRAEEGGSSLVLDEINHYGRKGKIFLVHFRNVRGSLPTAGAFEEALLDDGDLNMFKILLELRKVGFNGCLNPDHVPILEGVEPDIDGHWPNTCIEWNYSNLGYVYSVGYIKALLAALVEFEG